VSRAHLIQVAHLAHRSVLRTLRQPAQIVPAIVFPLFLLAVNSGGLDSAENLPGFPTDSYLTFALAVPFVQAALFAIMGAGSDLARDIETGFFDRLALTPMSGPALIAGQLAGVLVLGLAQALTYIGVGLAIGADFASGFGGVLVLLALSLSIVFAFGCVGVFLALRFGTGEAVQGMFPLLFVFLFLSSMALPRPLIEQDWFRTIATYNPISYLLEGIRSLLIDGFDGEALALGFGCAGAIAAIFMLASTLSLRTRLVRT
jgi:ABC-2 type transport system permease protein